jgi:hypothetical protein
MPVRSILLFIGLLLTFPSSADVVKPALTEISVFADGSVSIEVRTSLEALLTGIDGRYKSTKDSPNADRYDEFRVQSSTQLAASFVAFHDRFIEGVKLVVDDKRVTLAIAAIDIPEPGYTKVPRTSTIYLTGELSGNHKQLQWYYPAAFGEHAVRVKLVDEAREFWHWSDYQWIRDDRISEPFTIDAVIRSNSWLSVFYTYIEAGYLHILPLGMDHILFILGLFLMSQKLRPLLWQVTMFTLAHSITLSLSVLGFISLPLALVEPLIALSIAYIAIENLFHENLGRTRLAVVFAFGLLHGLGFAAMLVEFGLPQDRYWLALTGFNLGVEFGQISILLLAWFGIALWLARWPHYRRWFVNPVSIVIAGIGLFWFWQRLPWNNL